MKNLRLLLPFLALTACSEEEPPPPSCDAVWDTVSRTAYEHTYTLSFGPDGCPGSFTVRDTDPPDPMVNCTPSGTEERLETAGGCFLRLPDVHCSFADGEPILVGTLAITATREAPPRLTGEYRLQYAKEKRPCVYSVTFRPL